MHGHSSPRARLNALGLRARKSWSQSFLDDPAVAAAIVRAADLDGTRDHVLEVGPGLGALTERLVRVARDVTAVEIDPLLADALRAEVPDARVLTADILTIDVGALFEEPFVVVANLPYHITSPVLRRLLASGPPQPSRLVVMVQAEVAERITARPGDLSALAVLIQSQATVRSVRRVPRTAFHPRPRVDSAVLRLEPRADPPITQTDRDAFEQLVHAGFKQPRKQLANSLADGLAVDKPAVLALLSRVGIDPSRRPQELTIDEWAQLFDEQRRA